MKQCQKTESRRLQFETNGISFSTQYLTIFDQNLCKDFLCTHTDHQLFIVNFQASHVSETFQTHRLDHILLKTNKYIFARDTKLTRQIQTRKIILLLYYTKKNQNLLYSDTKPWPRQTVACVPAYKGRLKASFHRGIKGLSPLKSVDVSFARGEVREHTVDDPRRSWEPPDGAPFWDPFRTSWCYRFFNGFGLDEILRLIYPFWGVSLLRCFFTWKGLSCEFAVNSGIRFDVYIINMFLKIPFLGYAVSSLLKYVASINSYCYNISYQ